MKILRNTIITISFITFFHSIQYNKYIKIIGNQKNRWYTLFLRNDRKNVIIVITLETKFLENT